MKYKAFTLIIFFIILSTSALSRSIPQHKKYKDGIYEGSGFGHEGTVHVRVIIEDSNIKDVIIIKHPEYEHEEALKEIPKRIIANGGIEGVEAITGATETTNAVLNAVKSALEKAVEIKKSASEATEKSDKISIGPKTILPAPVWVIGSYDNQGKPNMMTAAWVGICCSRPPCVAISLRSATYTHGNIIERKAFTVNLPTEELAGNAAYFGSVSGRDVDKLKVTGLTAIRGDSVDAPYLKEFPINIECRVVEIHELGSHTMFIGEIKDVKVDPSILNRNGYPDIEKLHPIIFSPGSFSFYKIDGLLGKISELREQ